MADITEKLPAHLWVVRHGESAGNVAREAAYAAKKSRIDIAVRDIDVPLSARGLEQAQALGEWFHGLDASARPDLILTSPYKRAVSTAEILASACADSAAAVPILIDERLREKEFGVLDRLTRQGIEEFYPEEARMRRSLGKFYHRPPGGESWCDVILRLRSELQSLSAQYTERRILIVAHQVVVLCLRYLLENLDEAQILAIDAQGDVANCAVTFYRRDNASAALGLVKYNWTVPLQQRGASVTASPDANEGTR